jgi:2-hydroxy-3-keto-5-methylthiopentenyl-1-phosphate phosphatase
MVEAVLEPFIDRITAIHAIDVNTEDSYLRVHSPYSNTLLGRTQ